MTAMRRIQHTLFLAGIVSLTTLAVYLPALWNGFVEWDDNLYVYDNLNIRSLGPQFIAWAFSPFTDGNWFPLTLISHALDYAVWGLNPFGHHLTNILLHAINTFVVVVLIAKLLAMSKSFRDTSTTATAQGGQISAFPDARAILAAAAVTGALFGLHPLHVESVAWVSERKDLLCGLFFLLSVLSYLDHAAAAGQAAGTQGSSLLAPDRRILFSFGWFLLALLSKPMAVSLPLVLLILDWHPFGRLRSLAAARGAFLEKLPFIGASLAVSMITYLSQRTAGSMEHMDRLSLGTRAMVAAKALLMYLMKMVYPADLSPYYPYPRSASFLSPEYLLSVAAVACIIAGAIAAARKNWLWFAAWGYYLVTLLPVLGIVQVGGQAMADRYTYLPSIAPFLICGLIVARMSFGGPAFRVRTVLVAGAALCAAFVLSIVTVRQIGVWKNGIALWDHIIAKDATHAPVTYVNRGNVRLRAGDIPRALEDFSRAIELNPDYAAALYARGNVYGMTGDLDDAIDDYSRAISADPAFKEALLGRAAAFDARGQTGNALDDYTRAIALDPDDANSYVYRGMTLKKEGLFDRAIEDYSQAIRLDPASFEAYNNRGVAYKHLRMYVQAVEDYNRAIEIAPRSGLAYCNRGIVFGTMGRIDEAVADLTSALHFEPDMVRALLERGSLYARTGRLQMARQDLQEACDRGSSEGCAAIGPQAGHAR